MFMRRISLQCIRAFLLRKLAVRVGKARKQTIKCVILLDEEDDVLDVIGVWRWSTSQRAQDSIANRSTSGSQQNLQEIAPCYIERFLHIIRASSNSFIILYAAHRLCGFV